MSSSLGPDRPPIVLLVEDSDLERKMMRQRLRLDGLSLIEAADGASALRLARDEGPDLVLLDLGLPDLCGLEVLARLKADPQTFGVPVVVVSSRSEVEVKV